MKIRDEQPDDQDAVRVVCEAAYGNADIATLVDELRADGLILLSRVADEYGEIVAHILFSEVEYTVLDQNEPLSGALLTTLCVAPTHQNLGIGSELIRQGLEIMKNKNIAILTSTDDPDFFKRFGFQEKSVKCLKVPILHSNLMIFC